MIRYMEGPFMSCGNKEYVVSLCINVHSIIVCMYVCVTWMATSPWAYIAYTISYVLGITEYVLGGI